MDDDAPTPIEHLPNLGPKSARVLRSVGITTVGELAQIGCVGAYVRARHVWDGASLNLLWSLAAGLRGVPWTDLDYAEKTALRAQLASYEVASGGDMEDLEGRVRFNP